MRQILFVGLLVLVNFLLFVMTRLWEEVQQQRDEITELRQNLVKARKIAALAKVELQKVSSADIWDSRDCWKYVYGHEELCDLIKYKSNCAAVCTVLTDPTDRLEAATCEALAASEGDKTGLAGCTLADTRENCGRTCKSWGDRIKSEFWPTLEPQDLDCGTLDEPAGQLAKGQYKRIQYPYRYTNRQDAIWQVRLSLLRRATTVLDELGIEYVLHQGSLLGAYRHGMQVPWDDDLDIYVLAPMASLNNRLENFKRVGIGIRPGSFDCSSDLYKPMCIYLSTVGKTPSDAFMVLTDTTQPLAWIDVSFETPVTVGGKVGYSTQGFWHLIDGTHYSSLLRPLQKCAFGDHKFYCPAKPKTWLCHEVGPNLGLEWRLKDSKNATWKWSSHNSKNANASTSAGSAPYNLHLEVTELLRFV